MKQVQISSLKGQLSKHLRAAEAGETIEVMDRARPIARVVPIAAAAAELETIPAECTFASVRRVRLPRIVLPVSSLELLRDERRVR